MTRKCCVPGCRSNYNNSRVAYVSTFSFPKDETARKLWLSKIGREDMNVTNCVSVCLKHFNEEDIMRERSAYDDRKNVILTCPLKTPRLREGAVPSIFPPTDPNDGKEERQRKSKRNPSKKIRDEACESSNEPSSEPSNDEQGKDQLLVALNLDPTIKAENKANTESVTEAEVKTATSDQVKRARNNKRERTVTKKFKNSSEAVRIAPSLFRVRLDKAKLASALADSLLANGPPFEGAVPKATTVPILPKPPPADSGQDPDHFFFMSLCSDFKEIQNPKTKAFLKMEFQRMVFNAKYEKPDKCDFV